MDIAFIHMKMWFISAKEVSIFEMFFWAQNSFLPLYICLIEALYSSNMRLGYALLLITLSAPIKAGGLGVSLMEPKSPGHWYQPI